MTASLQHVDVSQDQMFVNPGRIVPMVLPFPSVMPKSMASRANTALRNPRALSRSAMAFNHEMRLADGVPRKARLSRVTPNSLAMMRLGEIPFDRHQFTTGARYTPSTAVFPCSG